MIVGHTHCNIDQIFSVVSEAIEEAEFVASPLGMQALMGAAHADIKFRPRFNIKVSSQCAPAMLISISFPSHAPNILFTPIRLKSFMIGLRFLNHLLNLTRYSFMQTYYIFVNTIVNAWLSVNVFASVHVL